MLNDPKDICEIPALAFRKKRELDYYVIPEETCSIGDAAFSYCTSLKHIVIPANVRRIGVAAFCCSGLETVQFEGIPDEIESSVFIGCRNLKQIILPEGANEELKKLFDLESSTIVEGDTISSN